MPRPSAAAFPDNGGMRPQGATHYRSSPRLQQRQVG